VIQLNILILSVPPFLPPSLTQGERGSFVAVGTFKPGIEIWDVDVIDPLEPTQILGGEKSLQG